MAGQYYEIRVKGHLGGEWSDWVERGLAIRNEAGGEAVLTGTIEDQTALHSVLTKIRDMGLTLVAVDHSDHAPLSVPFGVRVPEEGDAGRLQTPDAAAAAPAASQAVSASPAGTGAPEGTGAPPVKARTLSGFCYPNKMGRLYLTALEEVTGANGTNAVLRYADLERFIGHYPSSTLDKQFDFVYIASLHEALEGLYGPRGGRGLEQRIGRVMFAGGLRDYGALAGAGDIAFKILPLSTKLRIGVPAIARVFNVLTDQISNVIEHEDHFIYTLERCSMCWQRRTDHPVCHTAVGIIQEALKWLSGGREFKVEMLTCIGSGAARGEIMIHKDPID
jgi:hypothetical protein